ncbi:cupin domain-containing protein [Paenibacillus sp. tmac-D7]|uniref:cupin domain-containing protein n=1 Tax=Paenibacillus sp. tmac-D7 TaxID=2591462 RepID=UPI001C642021|nr:cupin domain-containing protein [Paenibacillus sp. tmac-D7]
MAMKVVKEAIKSEKPSMGVPDTKAFLVDTLTSANPEKTITSGFFRMEKSKPLSYTYTYDEMKIIVEGEIWITDETERTVKGIPGDVFYFEKGSEITFNSPDYGIGFFVGLRKVGEA